MGPSGFFCRPISTSFWTETEWSFREVRAGTWTVASLKANAPQNKAPVSDNEARIHWPRTGSLHGLWPSTFQAGEVPPRKSNERIPVFVALRFRVWV